MNFDLKQTTTLRPGLKTLNFDLKKTRKNQNPDKKKLFIQHDNTRKLHKYIFIHVKSL